MGYFSPAHIRRRRNCRSVGLEPRTVAQAGVTAPRAAVAGSAHFRARSPGIDPHPLPQSGRALANASGSSLRAVGAGSAVGRRALRNRRSSPSLDFSRSSGGGSVVSTVMRSVVSLHYTFQDSAGWILDPSMGMQAVTRSEGADQSVDGLDEQLRSAAAGFDVHVDVLVAKACGEFVSSQVQPVKNSRLFKTEEDQFAPTVTEVSFNRNRVFRDAIHPAVGVDFTSYVDVLGTRAATADELRQAHERRTDGSWCD